MDSNRRDRKRERGKSVTGENRRWITGEEGKEEEKEEKKRKYHQVAQVNQVLMRGRVRLRFNSFTLSAATTHTIPRLRRGKSDEMDTLALTHTFTHLCQLTPRSQGTDRGKTILISA